MTRTKIDYGIDLGTTNSAIARIERAEANIKKSLDTQKDTTPSCISFNQKGALLVGDKAYNNYRSNSLKGLSKGGSANAYVEFKRTMGTDKKYHSSHADKDFTSEELSAEVLKELKKYVQDEDVKAVVITVPAAFKINQVDATRRAGQLAGFDHLEVLQEPVAASMAYGLDSAEKDGFWLVFDFGGGTFDAALLKVEEGIMKVIDTEGDNYLGGKNLDYAVVDQLIIPHIQENYVIDNLLGDEDKKTAYRSALKFFAEEIKNHLSFKPSHDIYVDPGECGEDDKGEEIEIDLTITQEQLKSVLMPIFQKSIDLSLDLIKRNNLSANSLDSLVMVGGPTLSPVLREMLEKQICKPDTDVDPMTVVAKGAALYASTVELSEEIREQARDKTKIQLAIDHEPSTVETEEHITIKILEDKTEGDIPEKIFAEINRDDNAWSSGKVEINIIGEILEIKLNEGKNNIFEITLYDNEGNLLESEPSSFGVIQGSKIGSATLPYHIGIEVKNKITGKDNFKPVKGLEKNQSLPATGTANGLKTQKQIRPGLDSDSIKIPLYQGEYGAPGTRAIHNEHVYDITLSGADLPALLPENSDVDLTVHVDKSQKMTVKAFFPSLDHTEEVEVPTDTVQSIDTEWLANEIRKAEGTINDMKEDDAHLDSVELGKIKSDLEKIQQSFDNNKNDVDTKQETLSNLRKTLKNIDKLNEISEWPKLEQELKDEYYKLEKANKELGDEKSMQEVNQLKDDLEEVIRSKDIQIGNDLLERIREFYVKLTLIYQLIGFIQHHDQNFDSYNWRDSGKARTLISQGLQKIDENSDANELHPIVISLIDLLPVEERKGSDDSLLVG